MFRCDGCGKTEGREKLVSEVFDVDRKSVRVENIPATVCTNCGEPVFNRETTEKVRRMVHGELSPSNPYKWMCSLFDSCIACARSRSTRGKDHENLLRSAHRHPQRNPQGACTGDGKR